MTREELEKAMGNEPKIQASFEVIGDDVKFIKLIVNGKENIVSVEELENTPSETYRETDDYENEIADLHNRLDIAEYDKERLREEVTILEEKLKALSAEPCDAISRKSLKHKLQEHHDFFVDAYGGFSNLPPNDKSRVDEIINCIAMVVNEPSIQPTAKENLVVGDCISRAEAMTEIMMFAGNVKPDEENVYIKVSYAVQLLRELPPVTPKTDVLDKIRAEIIELRSKQNMGVMECLDIIDKYRAESEDKE